MSFTKNSGQSPSGIGICGAYFAFLFSHPKTWLILISNLLGKYNNKLESLKSTNPTWCARRVSGITYVSYTHSKQIRNQNKSCLWVAKQESEIRPTNTDARETLVVRTKSDLYFLNSLVYYYIYPVETVKISPNLRGRSLLSDLDQINLLLSLWIMPMKVWSEKRKNV
jgi:hypothetical protein